MRLLDLFCGRWGWSRAFAARGWECVGVDLIEPSEMPKNCTFLKRDILEEIDECFMYGGYYGPRFDFIVASSPCEQFSVYGLKCFHPNPPYPELGIKLFNHARQLCEASGVPYVMENVKASQRFIGTAAHHCGPFYLWGSGVPPLLPRGITKGMSTRRKKDANGKNIYRGADALTSKERAATGATIPPELANCVADYAERLLERVQVNLLPSRSAPAGVKRPGEF